MPEWLPTAVMGALIVVLAVVCALLLRAATRFRHAPPSTATEAPEPIADAHLTLDSVLQALSARVATMEGQLPTLRSGLEGYGALATRLSAVETQIPAVADAYEKFTDAFERKGKRDTVRETRAGKSAGQAAAETFGIEANAGADPAGGTPRVQNGPGAGPAESPKLAGVRGRGGRSTFRRG